MYNPDNGRTRRFVNGLDLQTEQRGKQKWKSAYTIAESTTGATVVGTANAPLSTKELKANAATNIAASLNPMKTRRSKS